MIGHLVVTWLLDRVNPSQGQAEKAEKRASSHGQMEQSLIGSSFHLVSFDFTWVHVVFIFLPFISRYKL